MTMNFFDMCVHPCVGSGTELLEVNYDGDKTYLYQVIEKKQWNKVSSEIKRNPISARTWVYRLHKDPELIEKGKLRWRMLPLHGAIIFGAPESVIEQLINSYPKAVRMFDDNRMIPVSCMRSTHFSSLKCIKLIHIRGLIIRHTQLHLAFRHSSTENVMNKLIDIFPNSLYVKDSKGRLPIELINLKPNGGMPVEQNQLRKYLASLALQMKEKDEELCQLEIELNAEQEEEDSVSPTMALQNTIAELQKTIEVYDTSLRHAEERIDSMKEELRKKSSNVMNLKDLLEKVTKTAESKALAETNERTKNQKTIDNLAAKLKAAKETIIEQDDRKRELIEKMNQLEKSYEQKLSLKNEQIEDIIREKKYILQGKEENENIIRDTINQLKVKVDPSDLKTAVANLESINEKLSRNSESFKEELQKLMWKKLKTSDLV